MIFWIILFLVIVTTSVILAIRSMNDYQESPRNFNQSYSLYLVKNTSSLNIELINRMFLLLLPDKLMITFEKLLKGQKQAAVIYAPKVIFVNFSKELDLVEIEDYQRVLPQDGISAKVTAWEMGINNFPLTTDSLNLESLDLSDQEYFWQQIIIQPAKSTQTEKLWLVSIRVVLITANSEKNKEARFNLERIEKTAGLISLPQIYNTQMILKFYLDRSFPPGSMFVVKRPKQNSKKEFFLADADLLYQLIIK